jgi:hypothetical protein
MTYKKQESNSEKAAAYPGLEAARAKQAGVLAQLKELDSKLEEAFAVRREIEASRDSVLIRAEAFLEGDTEALPRRDLEAEIKNLLEQRGILAKAVEIQQARVDEAAREAASGEYRRLKPHFILAIKKMMTAVKDYRTAVETMAALRNEMTAAGLPCGFPPGVFFPGWTIANFDQKRDTLVYTLKMAGLEIKLD